MEYEATIGIEIHCQLKTNTKMFSGAPTSFGRKANTCVNEIDLGHPGTLPSVNVEAVKKAIQACTALHLEIDPLVKFDRKNYYYSDLPKGFQITQQFHPIGRNGYIEINTSAGKKKIRIERIHMEEDTAKQFHLTKFSLLDFNRAGTPAPKGSDKLGVKNEIKNLNSISHVGKAVEYEIQRQKELLEAGEVIHQETRRYDEKTNTTVMMRRKEGSVDYKFFPEPNIFPIQLDPSWIQDIQEHMPELPEARKERYAKQYALSEHDIRILIADMEMSKFFEEVMKYTTNAKAACNWLLGEVSAWLNKHETSIDKCELKPEMLAKMIALVDEGKVSSAQAKQLCDDLMLGKDPEVAAEEKGLKQVSDSSALTAMVNEVLDANAQAIEDYKNGKGRAVGFLVGQVMKKSKGQANPGMVSQILEEELKKRIHD